MILPPGGAALGDYARGLEAAARADYATAKAEWQSLAEREDAAAMNGMGWLYHRGFGVTRDLARARELYRRSADLGFAKAQANLGAMYRRGEGVAQNYQTAIGWYRHAAEQGFASAQYHLAEMYRLGRGAAPDYETAIYWYKRAAGERGDSGVSDPALRYYKGDEIISAAAANRLGMLYYNGEGVAQDYRVAFRWYRQAAEQGNEQAGKALAKMYLLGRGTERDLEAAYEWWSK